MKSCSPWSMNSCRICSLAILESSQKLILKRWVPGVGGACGGNTIYLCMKLEKWDLFETIPRMGERGIKDSDGGDEFNHDIM
jgi:hypothetical protein